MSTDKQRSSSLRPSAPESCTSEEAPKSPKQFSRLRHRLETYRCDGFKCVYCGKDLLADSDSLLLATVDHIVPLAAGGGDGGENRATCCCVCNRLKGCTVVRSIEEGRQVIAQRREEEFARFREAWGELAPPRSPELVAMAASVGRLDTRTLSGQAVQLTLLAQQQAGELGRLAAELKQRSDVVQEPRGESSAQRAKPRRPWWKLRRPTG